ncbi:ImmA/IrrE family metallo-endopeptidase, partial [[Clostridium] scindens]
MADTKIIAATLEVFQECKVRSFPVDCCSLLRHYGYKVYTYKELKMKNNELYEMCMGYSDDAFQDGCTGIIAYNQDKPAGRSRFSLMHELGHHVFAHVGNSARNEREANAFASNLLAP